MRLAFRRSWLACLLAILALAAPVSAQSTTGTIQGVVKDNQDAVIPGATVTVRHVETNTSRTLVTEGSGGYRFLNMPVGAYELTVELNGFSKYVRSGITLSLNQDAVVDVLLQPASVSESIEVRADAPLLNTTNAEVGVRFDTRRVAELPVMNSRDVFALALSAPGVSQLGSGQSVFASGTNFSSNGMRVRSNNFMIDGQDSNDPSVTGRQQQINNTDIIQEVRLITNQFAAEFGRAAGSIVNVATKSGTNMFRGSGFIFHNDEGFNSRSNLDKRAGRTEAPFREENQWGGTLGGPIFRDRTFFFGSYQRWTDRQLGSGFTLSGAPTEAGRQVLQSAAGTRAQVAALLNFVPAGTANGKSESFTIGGQTFSVPLGDLTGSSSIVLNDNQFSGAHRSPAVGESPAGVALHGQHDARQLRERAGHAARSDDGGGVEPAFAQHLAEQRGGAEPVERVPRGVVTSRHRYRRAGPVVARHPVARDHLARHDRLQRRGHAHRDRPGGEPAAVPLQRHLSVPEQPDVDPRHPRVQGRRRRPPPVCEELLLPDHPRPAALRQPADVRGRRGRGGQHQQAAARRRRGELLPLVGSVLLRAGRMARRAVVDPEPGAALRAARQQHSEPDRAERPHPRRQRQQPRVQPVAGAEERQEQLPAARELQLVAANRRQRPGRQADRR